MLAITHESSIAISHTHTLTHTSKLTESASLTSLHRNERTFKRGMQRESKKRKREGVNVLEEEKQRAAAAAAADGADTRVRGRQ